MGLEKGEWLTKVQKPPKTRYGYGGWTRRFQLHMSAKIAPDRQSILKGIRQANGYFIMSNLKCIVIGVFDLKCIKTKQPRIYNCNSFEMFTK